MGRKDVVFAIEENDEKNDISFLYLFIYLKYINMACKDCRKNNNICRSAVIYGHLECLIWARRNGCPWDEWICTWAAHSGNLHCLIWARRNGCPWNWKTCVYAVQMGYLECLMWARKNGCPWNVDICMWAAREGNLECLMWARRNACPWNENTCDWATVKGYKDILKWIHRNGSPCACGKDVYIKWDEWEKDEECNICLEKLDETTVKFCGCRHRYHKECMDTMLKEMNGKKGCSVCARGK